MMADQRASLNLRVPEPLKDRVARYARRRGLSHTAAAIVLLEDALDRDDQEEGKTDA